MSLFYQQDINGSTKLGVWQIREPESFFLQKVPLQREITHPHKRLQHLAGRYLLKYLFDDFPYDLIRIADTRKPFLQNEAYHFSISHCLDFAAAVVSKNQRVGVDVEMSTPKIGKVLHKFLHSDEQLFLNSVNADQTSQPFLIPTLLWSAKESVFKWYGNGGVDFSEDIRLSELELDNQGEINCFFGKEMKASLKVQYKLFGELCLSWVNSDHTG